MFGLKGHTLYHVQFVIFLISEISGSQMVSYIFHFLMGKTTELCVPGCSNKTGKLWQYIIDECAARDPQVTEQSRQSFIQ